MFDKMFKTKGKIVAHADNKVNAKNVFKKQKLKRKKAERCGNNFDDTRLKKAEYVMQDSSAKEKLYTKEYKRLKKELSYKSPEPSPCSSLEESSESDGDKGTRRNLFGNKEDDNDNISVWTR